MKPLNILKWVAVAYAVAVALELIASVRNKGVGGDGFSLVPGFVWDWWRSAFFEKALDDYTGKKVDDALKAKEEADKKAAEEAAKKKAEEEKKLADEAANNGMTT